MKPLSFYSKKKKDKFLWIPVILILTFVYSCGPSKEEIDARNKKELESQLKCQQENKYSTPLKGKCGCDGHTMLKYYDDNGCEYIGHLSNSSSDYISHSGDCKKCHKQDSLLIESILKRFFQVKK